MADEDKLYDGRKYPRDHESEVKAAQLADKDLPANPDEFLREIYKEAYNTKQWPEDRDAKLMAKHSAILLRILSDHHDIHRTIKRLTWAIFLLTVVLVAIEIANRIWKP